MGGAAPGGLIAEIIPVFVMGRRLRDGAGTDEDPTLGVQHIDVVGYRNGGGQALEHGGGLLASGGRIQIQLGQPLIDVSQHQIHRLEIAAQILTLGDVDEMAFPLHLPVQGMTPLHRLPYGQGGDHQAQDQGGKTQGVTRVGQAPEKGAEGVKSQKRIP